MTGDDDVRFMRLCIRETFPSVLKSPPVTRDMQERIKILQQERRRDKFVDLFVLPAIEVLSFSARVIFATALVYFTICYLNGGSPL